MLHSEKSPLAGKTVRIKASVEGLGGRDYQVQDWWDRISGKSWATSTGNAACLQYAARIGPIDPMPSLDDEVVYGKIGGLGYLVHMNEIEIPAPATAGKP